MIGEEPPHPEDVRDASVGAAQYVHHVRDARDAPEVYIDRRNPPDVGGLFSHNACEARLAVTSGSVDHYRLPGADAVYEVRLFYRAVEPFRLVLHGPTI